MSFNSLYYRHFTFLPIPIQPGTSNCLVWLGFGHFVFLALSACPLRFGEESIIRTGRKGGSVYLRKHGGDACKGTDRDAVEKNRARLLGLERNALPEAASPLLHPSQFQFHRFIRVYPFTRTRPADVLATGKLLPPCLVAY
jgi:hypothetical protein